MQEWLAAKHFHTLPEVAVGCKLMLTTNIDLSSKACNGAIGTATGVTYRAGRVSCVVLQLETGAAVTVRRMTVQTRSTGRQQFSKETWPLVLAYAITAHKAQGATIDCTVLVSVREAFCAGLLGHAPASCTSCCPG